MPELKGYKDVSIERNGENIQMRQGEYIIDFPVAQAKAVIAMIKDESKAKTDATAD